MIGHDIAAALPELRAQAESLHVEVCSIDRETTTWSEAEQKSVTVWTSIHADLPCAVDIPPARSRVLVADEAATPEQPVVKVAHDVEGIEPDDRVTVAGYGVMWVTHVPLRSHQVQRRIECRWQR